jgi:hypothetical protein
MSDPPFFCEIEQISSGIYDAQAQGTYRIAATGQF